MIRIIILGVIFTLNLSKLKSDNFPINQLKTTKLLLTQKSTIFQKAILEEAIQISIVNNSKMFSPDQLAESMLKSVTQEELNQCMQFCAKYNILYAMHKFPIKLQIIDERRKEKVVSAKQKEGSKFEKPSQSMAMPKQKQKVSKFQKPSKKAAKKFQGNIMKVDKYEPSQVQKYSIKDDDKQDYFEQKSLISKFEKNRSRGQGDKTKPASNHNTDDGSGGNDIDLVRLVSQLAVGGTDTNQKYRQPNDNGIFLVGYSSNKGHNYQNYHTNVFYKPFSPQQNSSLYPQNLAQQSARSLYYQQPREQYSNPYASSPYSQLDKVNQSIYDIGNFMMSPYQNNIPIQSPYVTQFRGFAQFNGESGQKDRKLERNLFNEKGNREKQTSSKANVNYGFNQASKPQFGREINPLPVSHPYTQIYNNSQPTFNSIQPQSPVSQHYRNLKISQSPSVPNLSGFQQQYIPASPRIHTPRANRSPSPLSNSASCRDFFNQSQKQKSVDRSGVSRSKSRRKEKPGGSKSFYQPSSSARRVVRKQRIDDDAEQYQEVKRQIDQSPIQEHNIRQNKVKGSSGNVKYPNRITRQTDLSGLSGYDPSTMVSKTTKSQQFVQNVNKSQAQHQKSPAINKNSMNQEPFKQTPKLSNRIQQSPQSRQQRSSQQVQLNNVDDEFQKISSSRRKVPSPILKIDLTTNNQGDSIRKK